MSDSEEKNVVKPDEQETLNDSNKNQTENVPEGEGAGRPSPTPTTAATGQVAAPAAPAAGTASETEEPVPKWAMVVGYVIGAGLIILLIWGFISLFFSLFFGGTGVLSVSAGLVSADEDRKVIGQVEFEENPAAKAKVRIELLDARGNLVAVPGEAVETNESGGFTVPVTTTDVDLLRVRAEFSKWWWWRTKTAERSVAIATDTAIPLSDSSERMSDVALGVCLLLWFILSVVVALMVKPKWMSHMVKYRIVLTMALLFPVFVVGAYAYAQNQLVTVAGQNRIVSLGVATVFKGTYSKDVPEEWLISLTLPRPVEGIAEPQMPAAVAETLDVDATPEPGETAPAIPTPGSPPGDPETDDIKPEDPKPEESEQPKESTTGKVNVVEGFGAPLWVLFLSVIGAGLFTIALVVKEIAEPPKKDNPKQLRARMQLFVEHEFYILFAPVGGMFIYQLMVIGGAVDQPITVALAALGAGLSINAILSRAVEASKRLVSTQEKASMKAQEENVADDDLAPATQPGAGQPGAGEPALDTPTPAAGAAAEVSANAGAEVTPAAEADESNGIQPPSAGS